MLNKKCRYIDCEGICTLANRLCDNCGKSRKIKYESVYNPFKDTTTISIIDRGKQLVSAEIYGQLSQSVAHEYAIDLCRLLVKKGVIK